MGYQQALDALLLHLAAQPPEPSYVIHSLRYITEPLTSHAIARR
jgi:hypothetical protein